MSQPQFIYNNDVSSNFFLITLQRFIYTLNV